MLADFRAKALIDELSFDSQNLAGCAAYMTSELLFPDGNINMDLFSKESDVYAYAILVCQKVCIQLILSIKKIHRTVGTHQRRPFRWV